MMEFVLKREKSLLIFCPKLWVDLIFDRDITLALFMTNFDFAEWQTPKVDDYYCRFHGSHMVPNLNKKFEKEKKENMSVTVWNKTFEQYDAWVYTESNCKELRFANSKRNLIGTAVHCCYHATLSTFR